MQLCCVGQEAPPYSKGRWEFPGPRPLLSFLSPNEQQDNLRLVSDNLSTVQTHPCSACPRPSWFLHPKHQSSQAWPILSSARLQSPAGHRLPLGQWVRGQMVGPRGLFREPPWVCPRGRESSTALPRPLEAWGGTG